MLTFALIATAILFGYAFLALKRPGFALITVPFVSFCVGFCAVVMDMIVYLPFAVAIFMTTLSVIAITKRQPDTDDWPHRWAEWTLVGSAVFLGLITAAVLFGQLGAGLALPVLFFLAIVLFITCVILYAATSAGTLRVHVFSTIAAAVRQNLPLPMALECAGAGYADRYGRALRRIKLWLVQGYPLSEAIRRGYPRCPGHAIALLRSAEQIGHVQGAVAAIEEDMVSKADERGKLQPVGLFYPLVILTIASIIVLALMTYVVPQFAAVLQEMLDTPLPLATRILIALYRFLIHDTYPVNMIVLALAVLAVPAIYVLTRVRPRRPEKPYLLSRIGDLVKWRLPILHWFERNWSMVQVVELLRLSLRAGAPVNQAIRSTLGLDVNHYFKKRLARWLERVERGRNVAQAAKHSGLGSPIAWAFDDQVNRGNTLSILETLETFYRTNYSYRVNLARFVMWPCVVIMLGLTVGFIVYAMYSPAVYVIRHMGEMIYP